MQTDGKCPCGIDSYNIYIKRDFDAMNTDIVVRTEWWHDEYEKCPAK